MKKAIMTSRYKDLAVRGCLFSPILADQEAFAYLNVNKSNDEGYSFFENNTCFGLGSPFIYWNSTSKAVSKLFCKGNTIFFSDNNATGIGHPGEEKLGIASGSFINNSVYYPGKAKTRSFTESWLTTLVSAQSFIEVESNVFLARLGSMGRVDIQFTTVAKEFPVKVSICEQNAFAYCQAIMFDWARNSVTPYTNGKIITDASLNCVIVSPEDNLEAGKLNLILNGGVLSVLSRIENQTKYYVIRIEMA